MNCESEKVKMEVKIATTNQAKVGRQLAKGPQKNQLCSRPAFEPLKNLDMLEDFTLEKV